MPCIVRSRPPQWNCLSRIDAARSFVIASEAKQSRATSNILDCFVASLLAMTSYKGAALSPRSLDSFEASEATTITTAIKPMTSVQIALISGFTPSRTSE